MRIAGYAAGGIGLIGLAVGTIFGVSAASKHSDATDAGCKDGACPNADAAGMEKDAGKAASVATIGFVAGGALLAGGIALVILAPKRDEGAASSSALRIAPALGHGSAGLTLSGYLF